MNSAIREKAGWFVRRLRSMPGSLQGFMWLGLILGPFATVASVLPGWMDEAGRPVSTIELWSMGAGPVCFAFGLGLFGVAMAFLFAWRPIRQFLLLFALGSGGYFFFFPDGDGVGMWVGPIVWSGILLWYFFFKKSVVAYFTVRNMPEGRRTDCL